MDIFNENCFQIFHFSNITKDPPFCAFTALIVSVGNKNHIIDKFCMPYTVQCTARAVPYGEVEIKSLGTEDGVLVSYCRSD